MAMNFTQEQMAHFNGLYVQAWRIIADEISLDGRELKPPGWLLRTRLEKAKRLFERALAIHPTGWNSMFAIGKIEQRLGREKAALDWFLKAREFEPKNSSLAKEASVTASRLGMHDMAARIADEAIELSPSDPSLMVNSGLAHILAGNCETALKRFAGAAGLDPAEVNLKLQVFATRVSTGTIPCPKAESDILEFVRRL